MMTEADIVRILGRDEIGKIPMLKYSVKIKVTKEEVEMAVDQAKIAVCRLQGWEIVPYAGRKPEMQEKPSKVIVVAKVFNLRSAEYEIIVLTVDANNRIDRNIWEKIYAKDMLGYWYRRSSWHFTGACVYD